VLALIGGVAACCTTPSGAKTGAPVEKTAASRQFKFGGALPEALPGYKSN